MKKQFIMVMEEDFAQYTLDNLRSDSRVIVLDRNVRVPNNRLLRLLRKIHLSRRIDSHLRLPFKTIWEISVKK